MQGTNRQGTEVKMHKMGYCFFEGRGRTNSNERIECEYFFFFLLSPHVVIIIIVELDIVAEGRMPIVIIIPGSIGITVLIAV